MKNYIVYSRVSTQGQGDNGISLDAQLDLCREYVKRVGGTILEEVQEVGHGNDRRRPGLIKALTEAKMNDATLLFAQLDRLARDAEYAYTIKNSGVDLYFLDFPDVNSFVFGVMVAMYENERERISSKTKATLAYRKKQIAEEGGFTAKRTGRWVEKLGGPDTAYIQELGTMAAALKRTAERINDERWQMAYKLASDLRRRGDVFKVIAEQLNNIGMLTRRGNKWSATAVQQMLVKSNEL